MRKSILFVVIVGLLFTFNQSLAAQEGIVTNKVAYAELGGAGIIWSVNLEGRFKDRERLGLGYRLGIGYLDDIIFFPVGVNYVFGKPHSAHTFVTGANITIQIDKMVLEQPIGFLCLMYRYMPVKEGISFHIAFTPFFEKEHTPAKKSVCTSSPTAPTRNCPDSSVAPTAKPAIISVAHG